jgi:hypothetical protein
LIAIGVPCKYVYIIHELVVLDNRKWFNSTKQFQTSGIDKYYNMRYNEFKLLEFADDNSAQTTSKLAPSAATQQVQPQQPQDQQSQQDDPRVRAYIERFIAGTIPEDLEPREAEQAAQYLRDRITDIRQLQHLDSDRIRIMLRAHYANSDGKLQGEISNNLNKIDSIDRSIDDRTTLTNLIGGSSRVSSEVIMTVMSNLTDGTMNLDQEKFDLVSNYSGRRANAEKIEGFLDSKWRTQHAVYLNFRDIKDAMGAVACVLLDTDRRLTYVGNTFRTLKLVTSRDGDIDTDKIRKLLVTGSHDRERHVLFDQTRPQLQRFQTMMNDDQILELYDMLNIDYEDDIIDKLTTNQGQENANFRTTQRKRTQRAPSKTARK